MCNKTHKATTRQIIVNKQTTTQKQKEVNFKILVTGRVYIRTLYYYKMDGIVPILSISIFLIHFSLLYTWYNLGQNIMGKCYLIKVVNGKKIVFRLFIKYITIDL